MSRWIDADAFAKSAVESGFGAELINSVTALIIDAPTIDLVRCAECKWAKANGEYQWCGRLDSTARITPDDFCSYGVRKESE